MRAALVLEIAILSAASLHRAAKARGERGSDGYGSGPVVSVRSSVTKNGSYVAPHDRIKADGLLGNNLSYRGGGDSDALRGSRLGASPDPLDVPAGTIVAVSQQIAPKAAMPWCSSGTVAGGFCVLH